LTGVIEFESEGQSGWKYKETFLGYPDADFYLTQNVEIYGLTEVYESYTRDISHWPANLYTSMDKINVTLWRGSLPQSIKWSSSKPHKATPSGNNVVVISSSPQDGRLDFYFH
jgi:hypothetical protein